MTPQSAIVTMPGAPIVDAEPWHPTTIPGHIATALVNALLAGRNHRARALRVALNLSLAARRVFH